MSDPLTLFSDPFKHFASYFVESDRRFVRKSVAMASLYPYTTVGSRVDHCWITLGPLLDHF
eukprot:16439684-Heterocapsa_arctica.AAC.1